MEKEGMEKISVLFLMFYLSIYLMISDFMETLLIERKKQTPAKIAES